jgi:hypothetical protein
MGLAQRFNLPALRLLALGACSVLLLGCGADKAPLEQRAPEAGSAELEAHSAEFERAVVQVTQAYTLP